MKLHNLPHFHKELIYTYSNFKISKDLKSFLSAKIVIDLSLAQQEFWGSIINDEREPFC